MRPSAAERLANVSLSRPNSLHGMCNLPFEIFLMLQINYNHNFIVRDKSRQTPNKLSKTINELSSHSKPNKPLHQNICFGSSSCSSKKKPYKRFRSLDFQ